MQPQEYYQERIKILQQQLAEKLERKTRLGGGRFLAMLLAGAAIYFTLTTGNLFVLIVVALLVALFVKLVFLDLDNKNSIKHTQLLITVNETETKALAGEYFSFEDGAMHAPHDHVYANDLDIFGHASLFQYVNRTTSAMGSAALAELLLHPATAVEISERQLAVKELAGFPEWRQSLLAYGLEKKIESSTRERLREWITQPNSFLSFKAWGILRYVLPAIILAITAAYIFDLVSNRVFNYTVLIFGILAYFISKRVTPVQQQLSRIVDEISVMTDSIALIEQANFASPLLSRLKKQFYLEQSKASLQLKELKTILDRMDLRYNPVVFIPLDIFLLWDLQQVLALEQWKDRNQQKITEWFGAVGMLEAMSSLATVHFNHPAWCFPEIKEPHFSIEGTDIGHPLINENKRVNNPISIQRSGELMLITGSNMAGKSTYLRSIGINVVLAMAGSVTCASRFAVSPVQLLTSMRIADNLEENTSTFYAELKKLKTIIEKVNRKEEVFILLDEILRGTNSLDRHTGSEALIKQLIKKDAVGIIATHDIALAQLKEQFPANILNHFFDVQVSNDELYFDYRLKEGVCNSLNASILMKKIGIEL
ncbi:MAG: hypothetical protein V4725_09200 [Bacteroidota bacterium]